MKKIIIGVSLILAVYAVGNTGCKKDKTDTSVTSLDSGTIEFHIHTNLGDSEVEDYGDVYTLDNGRQVSLNLAQFYISDIQLVKSDGTTYPIAGKMLLKTLETEAYEIAKVPVGDYKAVKFKVGLDATTNALDATANDLLNHSEMWFGGTAQPDGYVFLNAQGMIDTTADASGTETQMQPFVYKIGTTAHYVQIALPDHVPIYTVSKGNTQFIHMVFDYSKLFDGVSLSNPSNLNVVTKADNSTAISTTIANNIANGFRYEE